MSAGVNDTLTITGISQEANRWVEVAPLVFRPASGLPASEELVFGKDDQGQINYIFINNNPTTAYERVDWKEGANFNYGLTGGLPCPLPIDIDLGYRLDLQPLPQESQTDLPDLPDGVPPVPACWICCS